MTGLDLNTHQLKHAESEYQLVVIDSFYDALDQETALDWLGKLFKFKVESYLASYPYGILPFGGTDLVGTQWVLCRREEGGLEPLMGFKTIDSRRTDLFRMEFPAYAIVSDPGMESHRAAVDRELANARAGGHGLGFLAGWAASPQLRSDPVISKLHRKVSSALFAHWLNHFDIQVGITFASLRFQVDKMHAYLGMTRLANGQGQPLVDFKARTSFDEPACASVIYRANHSEASLRDCQELSGLWEDRIVIASRRSPFWRDIPFKKAA